MKPQCSMVQWNFIKAWDVGVARPRTCVYDEVWSYGLQNGNEHVVTEGGRWIYHTCCIYSTCQACLCLSLICLCVFALSISVSPSGLLSICLCLVAHHHCPVSLSLPVWLSPSTSAVCYFCVCIRYSLGIHVKVNEFPAWWQIAVVFAFPIMTLAPLHNICNWPFVVRPCNLWLCKGYAVVKLM